MEKAKTSTGSSFREKEVLSLQQLQAQSLEAQLTAEALNRPSNHRKRSSSINPLTGSPSVALTQALLEAEQYQAATAVGVNEAVLDVATKNENVVSNNPAALPPRALPAAPSSAEAAGQRIGDDGMCCIFAFQLPLS